jgi:predicted nucleic acid-binding protein
MFASPARMSGDLIFGLHAPDALHLAISRRLDVALVTFDRRMAAAARELGIAVEEPTTGVQSS